MTPGQNSMIPSQKFTTGSLLYSLVHNKASSDRNITTACHHGMTGRDSVYYTCIRECFFP